MTEGSSSNGTTAPLLSGTHHHNHHSPTRSHDSKLLMDIEVLSPTRTHTTTPSIPLSPRKQHMIGVCSLTALVFFSVSGGPFGMEECLRTAGPLVTMVGLAVLPLLWSCPEALITAELAPTFREASGSVAWVSCAFGNFWGFMKGYLSWLSGVTDNSLYPVLVLDYVLGFFSSASDHLDMEHHTYTRPILLLGLTLALTYLNYRGLDVVGNTAMVICIVSMLPFVIMCGWALLVKRQELDWSRLGALPEGGLKGVQWNAFLNVLFWQLNYWDSVSTFSEDVKNPGKVFPRAMLYAIVLVVLTTALPLIIAVVGTSFAYSQYKDGFFSVVGEALVGKWLGVYIVFASVFSSVGMFESEMSSDAFMLMGLAERGHIPALFAKRSAYGTPTAAICFSACGIVVLSSFSFLEIVEMLNFLYMLAMLLEFFAFVWLRIKRPDLHRPFRIPLNTPGICLLLLGPVLLLCYLLAIASPKTWLFCSAVVMVGILLYFILHHPTTRRCCHFLDDPFSPRNRARHGRIGGGGVPVVDGGDGDGGSDGSGGAGLYGGLGDYYVAVPPTAVATAAVAGREEEVMDVVV